MGDHFHLPPDQITFDPTAEHTWEPISTEILKHIHHRDAKVIIGLAVWCGWTIHKGKLFHLRAHDGTSMEVPTNTNLNIRVFRGKIRTVLRHRAPAADNAPIGAMIGVLIDTFKVSASHANVLNKLANEVKPVGVVVADETDSDGEPAPNIPLGTVGGKYRGDYDMRRIVKEEPWSAHSRTRKDGKTETYPSKAVMERTWSDGTIDYACRWDGCSYTNEMPISTSRHYGAHRRGDGKEVQAPPDGLDLNWTPQKRGRVAKLRREIDGGLTAALAQGIDFTVVDQAQWLAEWIIDHRTEPVPADTDTILRELTPEEILDRIAALVDRGRNTILREQIDTLNRQLESFMSEVDEARQQAAAAEAKALRAANNFHTMKELIVDLDTEETE